MLRIYTKIGVCVYNNIDSSYRVIASNDELW